MSAKAVVDGTAQWRGLCAHCIDRIYANPSLDEVGDRGVVAQGRGLPDVTAFREAAGMGGHLVGRGRDSKVIHLRAASSAAGSFCKKVDQCHGDEKEGCSCGVRFDGVEKRRSTSLKPH